MSRPNDKYANLTPTRYARDTTLFPIVVSTALASKAFRLAPLDVTAFDSIETDPGTPGQFATAGHQLRFGEDDEVSSDSGVSVDESDAACAFSPLSMLFEGIMADYHFHAGNPRDCQKDSSYPYSPRRPSLEMQHSAPTQQDKESNGVRTYALLHSELPSPSQASSSTLLPTPHSSCCSSVTAKLDRTLAELIAENAISLAKSASEHKEMLELPAKSLLLDLDHVSPSCGMAGAIHRPPRKYPIAAVAERSSVQPWTRDAESVQLLTMPGGGPLLESPLGDTGLSPFWCSSTPFFAHQPCTDDNSPVDVVQKTADSHAVAAPPRRPPRPPHSLSLESRDQQQGPCIADPSSPSLRSLRKPPAEYLKSPRLRSSISLQPLQSPQVPERTQFELDPASAPRNAQQWQDGESKQVDRCSAVSVSTFVSAKSDLSIQPIRRSVSTEQLSISSPVGGQDKLNAPSSSSSVPVPVSVQSRRVTQPPLNPAPPPTHSSRSVPLEMASPQLVAMEPGSRTQRKPGLFRKLSLPLLQALRSSTKPLNQSVTNTSRATVATDYSKIPTCTVNTTWTNLNRSTTSASQPLKSNPTVRSPRKSALKRSNTITTNSSTSTTNTNSNSNSNSSGSNTSTAFQPAKPLLHSTKSTRLKILDSATSSCVVPNNRKVSFGAVHQYPPRPGLSPSASMQTVG